MQSLDYTNKVVMITGAGGGMGALAAKNFAKAGAKLAICDVNQGDIDTLAIELKEQGCEVYHQVCDVSDESQVKGFVNGAVKKLGALHVAINNAGIIQPLCHIHELDIDALDRQYNVNVKGVFTCMKYQLPFMKAQKSGAILNMSSAAGVFAAPYLAAYSAAKHAVIGITRSAAVEYGRNNIRVNALCPGYVDSPMMDKAEKDSPISNEKLAATNPMKRLATMQEIVNTMLWVCSDYNSYMNGQAVVIDGGMTAI